jgi:hypothetical protein
MVKPLIVNVICSRCKNAWMNVRSGKCWDYFCYSCGNIMTYAEAKKEAWKSGSQYYGE